MPGLKPAALWIILLALIWPVVIDAQVQLDCARCHQNSAMQLMLRDEQGWTRNLYIDTDEFKKSWHYSLGEKTRCIQCHEDIKVYPHERIKKLRCSECHEIKRKQLFEKIEFRIGQSIHKDLDCNDCHDVHRNRPAVSMTLQDKNGQCLNCHEYGPQVSSFSALRPMTLEDYHSWHPQAQLHFERMACIVCHTQMGLHGSADKHLIRSKSTAIRECRACHRGDGKIAKYLIDVGSGSKAGMSEKDMLNRIYLVGGTRNKWVEILGGSFLMLALLGVAGHASLRILVSLVRSLR